MSDAPWGPTEHWSEVMVHSRPLVERRILLVGPFQRVFYLGESILGWSSGPVRIRVLLDPLAAMLWTHELMDDDLVQALHGSPTTRYIFAR